MVITTPISIRSLCAAIGIALALAAAHASVADFYERSDYVLPPGLKMEASGLAVLPDGRVAIAVRKGEIWLLENPSDNIAHPERVKFTRFASGLHEPLGLTWHEGALYTTQRGEVTRVRDLDGNGTADSYEAVAQGWGLTGNYHEYAYGPVFDRAGNLWITLNTTIGPKQALSGIPPGDTPWRGWAMMQSPGGALRPVAAGLRSPFGVGANAEGDVFATDQQGNWWGTGPLLHLRPGVFFGHADALRDVRRPESPVSDPGPLPTGLTVAEAAHQIPGFALPAVWFPYSKMGQSATGIVCDTTRGDFGPFAGQLFIGEFTLAQVNRVYLEKVDRQYQGACFPFIDRLKSAVLQMAFLRDGSMLVGQSNRGWNSVGSRSFGLERLKWNGQVPFDILKMEALPDGFRLTFTKPLSADSAITPENFELTSYTYRYHQAYGSPEVNTMAVMIKDVELEPMGTSVRLRCANLRAGYVHELKLSNVQSRTGEPLANTRAYYTLNRIPSKTPETAPGLRSETGK